MTRLLTFLLMAGLAFPALLDAAQDGTGTNRLGSTVFKSGVTVTIGDVPRTNWPSGEGSTNVFSVGTNGLVPGPATENDGLLDADGTWMGKTNITIAMTNFYNLLLRATPIGAIQMYSGLSAPAGWKKCDGASYTTNAEPNLFAVVGYTYGGSAANFNVPNLVQRFPYGGTNDLGTTGGSNSHLHAVGTIAAGSHSHTTPAHTLLITEIPAHHHKYSVRANATGFGDSHAHPTLPNNSGVEWYTDTQDTGGGLSHSHGDTGSSTPSMSGSTAVETNLPPYIVVNYIIKK